MSQILPFKSEVEVSRDSPRVIALEGEESEAIFSALASDTSRSIYRTLYEEPATASEVADQVDTSVQNARYHLEKLEAAGLIDAVDTWYSSRGNEMTVYAAMDEALIVAGDKHRSSELRSLFKGSAGAMVFLAALSVIVQGVVAEYFTEPVRPGVESGDAGNEFLQMDTVPQAVDVLTVEPGVLVFLGGLVIIGMATAMRYQQIRSMTSSDE